MVFWSVGICWETSRGLSPIERQQPSQNTRSDFSASLGAGEPVKENPSNHPFRRWAWPGIDNLVFAPSLRNSENNGAPADFPGP